MCFLIYFHFGWSVHWWKWGVKIPHYFGVTADFSLLWLLVFALYIEVLYVGCIYICHCYIFFLNWSLDHYVVSFFVSYDNLYFEVYFVWYEYCHSSFLLISIWQDQQDWQMFSQNENKKTKIIEIKKKKKHQYWPY